MYDIVSVMDKNKTNQTVIVYVGLHACKSLFHNYPVLGDLILEGMIPYLMGSLNLLHCITKSIPWCITTPIVTPVTSCCTKIFYWSLITSTTHWCFTYCIPIW